MSFCALLTDLSVRKPGRTGNVDPDELPRDPGPSPISLAEIVYLVGKNHLPQSAYDDLKIALADHEYVIEEAPFNGEIVEAMLKVPRAEVPENAGSHCRRHRQLRSEKRKTANGFEAQNRKNEELRLKNERHEMKKDHHEWDIRMKDAAFCHRVGLNVSHTSQAARENPGFEAQYIAEVEAKLNRDREGAHSSEGAQSAAA